MNITTLLGLLVGAGAMAGGVVLEKGELGAFLNLPAMLVVFGGTFGATMVSFPGNLVAQLPAMVKAAFFHRAPKLAEVARILVRLSERARREGLLALEEELKGIHDPLLQRGLMLVVDGTDPELVRDVLESDMEVRHQEDESRVGVLEAMGGYSPTMGIIGTVMGLVHVLSQLSDPTRLGEAISVAFIATFYGVASANLLWLPMASKLKKQGEADQRLGRMVLEGLGSIQAGENPRVLQERLKPYLPARQRNLSPKESGADGLRGGLQKDLQPGQA